MNYQGFCLRDFLPNFVTVGSECHTDTKQRHRKAKKQTLGPRKKDYHRILGTLKGFLMGWDLVHKSLRILIPAHKVPFLIPQKR